MAKEPDERYPSASALAAAARQIASSGAHSGLAPVVAQPDPGPPERRQPGRRALNAAAAAVVVAAGVAIPIWRTHNSRPVPPAASTIFARVSATVPIGKHPEGVVVDPVLRSAYAADYSDNAVSVIDTTSHRVTAKIPVGHGPIGIAVDPTTHTLYTGNNRDDTSRRARSTPRTPARRARRTPTRLW